MVNKKVIHSVFENTVAQKPDNIAIEMEDVKITYSKLNSQANQIAHLLENLDIEKADVVAVFFNQVLVQILSLIGIFKKGAIYLPLDKKYKQNHWGELFTKIRPKALLASQEYFETIKAYSAIYEYSIPKVIIVSVDSELEYAVYTYTNGDYIKDESINIKETSNLEVGIDGEDANHIFFTSGSTGKPKAVLGNHKSLSHFIHWETKELQVSENDKIGQLTSLSFDASLRDIFLPLMNGARICIPTAEVKEDVNQLSEWLKEEKITIVHTVPTMLRLLLNADHTNTKTDFAALRYLLLAGEKLYNRDITLWREKNRNNTCIINLYGATESTLVKSFHRIENDLIGNPSDSISVGKPISNTALIILNAENKLCNVQEKGSIYIKTPFLSSGYYKDEAHTKAKFIQNPLSSEKDIIYKTGDYGKYDSARNITVLGREDGVLKINGIRCDINSIESTILALEEVSMVKCLVEEQEDDNKSIICFYTSEVPLEETIRDHCYNYLPHYEIPSLMIHLASFPTNANGKIDTIYLKNKIKEVSADVQDYVAPINDIEARVVAIWKEVLKRDQVGTKNNFLSLGGNSIKQVLLRSKIATEFNVNVSIEDLFTYATITKQASLIASLMISQAGNAYSTIKPVLKNTEGYAVSNEQLRIWITSQGKEESIAHNMSYTYDIQGDFDVSIFNKAVEKVIERHEILRTYFLINDQGNVVQKVLDEMNVDHMFTHLTLKENITEDQIKEQVKSFCNYAFDLEKAPLFKLQLLDTGNQQFILSTLMHHIIGDYTSDQIIIGEILKLYNAYKENQPLELKPLEVQYKDYASWITNRLNTNEFVAEKKFWKEHLQNVYKQEKWYLPIATTDYSGEYYIHKVPTAITKQIKEYCSKNNQNVMSVFATALGVLIHKVNSQQDVIIGLPINLRNHPDLLNQVGLYLNVLPLKIKIDPQNTIQTILDKASKDQIKMMDNSFYPFDNIVEDFEQENSVNLLDRIDVYMNFINHRDGSDDDALKDVVISPRAREMKTSKFPICFYINNRDTELSIRIEYQTCIFDQKEISRLGTRFMMCLEKIIKTPDTSVQAISLVETASIPVFSLG